MENEKFSLIQIVVLYSAFLTDSVMFRFRNQLLNCNLIFLYLFSRSQIKHMQPFDLRRRLFISFKGEEGLDYGGVAR